MCGRALQCDRASKGKNWEVEKKSLQGLAAAAGLPQGLAPSMQATVLASMGLTPQQAAAASASSRPNMPGLPAPLSNNAPSLPAPLSNAPGLPAPLSNTAGAQPGAGAGGGMGLQPL